MFNLIRVQQAVVNSELHKLGQKVQNLSLESHGGAGCVLLQSFYHEWFKETDVVVDGILGKQFQKSSILKTTTKKDTKDIISQGYFNDIYFTINYPGQHEIDRYLVASVACCIRNV